MQDDKIALRRELRRRLQSLTPTTRAAASEQLCAHLVARFPDFAGRLVAGFLPLPSEPDLGGFYRHVHAAGGRIAVPFITGPHHMEFRVPPADVWRDDATLGAQASPSALRSGPHGLREPDPAVCPMAAAPDLALVPGLGFAPGGARLGRGAGYYDRWLAGLPAAPRTIGVTFACQLLPHLPMESHDWRVDCIVTEHGWTPGAGETPAPLT